MGDGETDATLQVTVKNTGDGPVPDSFKVFTQFGGGAVVRLTFPPMAPGEQMTDSMVSRTADFIKLTGIDIPRGKSKRYCYRVRFLGLAEEFHGPGKKACITLVRKPSVGTKGLSPVSQAVMQKFSRSLKNLREHALLLQRSAKGKRCPNCDRLVKEAYDLQKQAKTEPNRNKAGKLQRKMDALAKKMGEESAKLRKLQRTPRVAPGIKLQPPKQR